MTKASVYIATTNGPVQIELISAENIPRSEVVLSGDFVPLDDLSSEYHHFVTGSGPVSRAFGPFNSQSFHMEISAPIDSGRSWHLAALIAHAFNNKQKLTTANESPDKIVLATGRIENSFEITSEHIEQKLEKSDALFRYARDQNIPIEIIGPKNKFPKNFEEDNISIKEIENAYEALDFFQLEYQQHNDAITNNREDSNNQYPKKVRPWWAAVLLLSIIFGFSISQMMDKEPFSSAFEEVTRILNSSSQNELTGNEIPVNKIETVSVKVFEVRPAENSNCAEIHLAKKSGKLTLLNKHSNKILQSPITKNLCGISVWFDQDDKNNLLILKMESGNFAGLDKENIELRSGQNNFFYIPRNVRNKIAYSLILKKDEEKSIITRREIVSQ